MTFHRHLPLAFAALLVVATSQDNGTPPSVANRRNLRSKTGNSKNGRGIVVIEEEVVDENERSLAIDLDTIVTDQASTFSALSTASEERPSGSSASHPIMQPFPLKTSEVAVKKTEPAEHKGTAKKEEAAPSGNSYSLTSVSDADADGLMRAIINCKPGLLHAECKQELSKVGSSDSEEGMTIVHDLLSVNSIAVLATDAQLEEVSALGYEYHFDVVREPLHIKESLQIENHRKLQFRQEVPYGVDLVRATEVWDSYGAKGANVKVCVVDTGMLSSHDDFGQGKVSGYNGREAVTPWSTDSSGHGTHVAGTVAAADNNFGVVGVAPEAEIYVVRVFGSNGRFYGSDLVAAGEICVDAGARIINMSLGGPYQDRDEINFFNNLDRRGIITVAASGNTGGTDTSYPAGYNNVISVAAVNSRGRLASFSTRNSMVDIAAPGVRIKSTWANGGYATLDGTSMASPHVAGVAALLLSRVPYASLNQVTEAIYSTARDLNGGGRDNGYGHGVVDAVEAMSALLQIVGGGGGNNTSPTNAPVIAPSPTPRPTPRPTPQPTRQPTSGSGGSSGSCLDLNLTFQTDGRTWENSHSLLRQSDNQYLWDVSWAFLRRNERYTQSSCLTPLDCYRFDINDRGRNGLQGSDEFTLAYGGSTLYSSTQFGEGGYLLIGDRC